jgi:subtilase-type serine protease
MRRSNHRPRRPAAALLAGVYLFAVSAHAQNATWLANPTTNDFNTATNWSPPTVPAGTAFFDTSTRTGVTFSTTTTVGGFTFNAGAPAYSFTPDDLTFSGAGIVNNSSNTPFLSAGAGLSGGTLTFRNASTAANATLSTFFGRILFFDSSSAASASVMNLGLTSRVEFHDNSKAGTATIRMDGGLLIFFNASSADNSTISINPLASVIFSDSSSAGNANISGSVGFSGFSTAASATITGGVISFGDNSTAGNATLITGAVRFFDLASGGTARFITSAGGTVDFSGLTSSGTTAGSFEGAGNYFLGSKQLTVGGNNLSTEVSGVISDGGGSGGTGGALVKAGTGSLTLSGTSTYTGATTVNAGALLVNGSIAASSSFTVNAGALVGGFGILPSTTINGTLSPGNSIGTITVNGNLVLGAGAIYRVEVSPTAADRTNVTGTASLNGTVNAVFGPGVYTSRSYTILSAAGGRTGMFSALTTENLSAVLTASLSYTATDALLVTLSSSISSVPGLTGNQRAVAAAQDTAFNTGLTAIPALFGLTSAQLPAGLDALSGEVHASTAGVLVDESRHIRQAVLGRLQQASYGGQMGAIAALSLGGPLAAFADGENAASAFAYAKSPITKAPPMMGSRDTVFWAQGFGAWGRFDTDGNAATVRRDLAGFISGVDTRVANDGRLGLAAGYTGSRNALDGRGSSNVETGHVAAYGGWRFGSINLRGGAAYAVHTIDTDRTVAFPGFFDRATAHYDGNTGQVFGELGYGVTLGHIAVEPFAGAAWVRVRTDAAAERGGLAALNVAGTTFETGYATLGTRAASMMPIGPDMILIPRASLAWQHAFDVTPSAVLAFQTAPVPFVISGVPIARDALLAEAGLDLAIGRHATLGVSYVGQIANTVQDHGAKGKFTWKF